MGQIKIYSPIYLRIENETKPKKKTKKTRRLTIAYSVQCGFNVQYSVFAIHKYLAMNDGNVHKIIVNFKANAREHA